MTSSSSRSGAELLQPPPNALRDGNGSGASEIVPPVVAPASPAPFANLAADELPTVITPRQSPPGDTSPSESVSRILHGRILPGERLGHFELLEFVGGGGMGKVFRARDTRLARIVALKILSPEHAADAETVLRFQNEAQSAARLDHENIARVYYVGEDRGLHFIVFEFIEGTNVRDMVANRGPLPLAEAVSYTLQVAEALTHASERNVVHRDIKPSNLLITPGGQAKLIDMGLARLREVDSPTDLTASGVTLGTFDYISPEQARDPRNANVRSDIYSLGCTFFYMLAGRPPFVGGTMLQKLLQHQGDQPPEVRQFRSDVPEEVNRILRRMLAKDPAHRYATATELVSDLLAVARAAGLRPAVSNGRRWTVPARPSVPYFYRHLPWVVSVVALLAIVFVLDHLWPYLPGPGQTLPSPAERGAGGEGALGEGKSGDTSIPWPDRESSTVGKEAGGEEMKGERRGDEGPNVKRHETLPSSSSNGPGGKPANSAGGSSAAPSASSAAAPAIPSGACGPAADRPVAVHRTAQTVRVARTASRSLITGTRPFRSAKNHG